MLLVNGESVSVNILDDAGKSVKELELETDKGLNFVLWDLMLDEEKMVSV